MVLIRHILGYTCAHLYIDHIITTSLNLLDDACVQTEK